MLSKIDDNSLAQRQNGQDHHGDFAKNTPQTKRDDLLFHLNQEQQQAVLATEGPVLVLAGAGTGKTRVLTTRIAYILQQKLCYPSQILALTFTNKAAREIKERVEALLEGTTGLNWMGTFHNIGAKILRYHANLAGLSSNFTIIDKQGNLSVLKSITVEQNLPHNKEALLYIDEVISLWKNEGRLPEDISSEEASNLEIGGIKEVYSLYQQALKRSNLCDFNDLLLHPFYFLSDPKNASLLAYYQEKFRYILIDEYQDINHLQYLFVRLFAPTHKGQLPNIFCVGDDDQTIYQWRGASAERILKFEEDFGKVSLIRLERNYRSTQHILGAASYLIAHNKKRYGKKLYPHQDTPEAEKVKIAIAFDDSEEAAAITREILTLSAQAVPLEEIAILVRTSEQANAFETIFTKEQIPYHIVKGTGLFATKEARDILGYLSFAFNLHNDYAFQRIINTPARGVGAKSLAMIQNAAYQNNLSLFSALRLLIEQQNFKGKSLKNLKDFIEQAQNWSDSAKTLAPHLLYQKILNESGYEALYKKEDNEENARRLENLKALSTLCQNFSSLDALLESTTLQTDMNRTEQSNGVNIMTIHASKGLEFDTVFLPGWENELFPFRRANEVENEDTLEEERRLAYVAMTRAKKRLYIWHTLKRRRYYGLPKEATPSRFLHELPKQHITQPRGQIKSAPPGQIIPKSYSNSYNKPSLRSYSLSKQKFTPEDRVFHKKFGHGTILEIEEDKLLIAFDKAGEKRVINLYVEKLS